MPDDPLTVAPSAAPPPLLSLRHLTLREPDGALLLMLDTLTVAAGQGVAICGPEGCGKSRLLRTLAGLLPLEGGELLWQGRPPAQWPERERPRACGVLFRDPDRQLITAYVWEEVALAPAAHGLTGEPLRQRVEQALASAGVDPSLFHHPLERLPASGRYRVALAAALALQPRLLLLDEPGGPLSSNGENALAEHLARWRAAGGGTITVTSRPERAARFGGALLWVADGRVQSTPPGAD